MIDFAHIVFLEVAKLLNFSKAADRLYLSQPSVSKHIKNLEGSYGVAFFERKGSGIVLTEEGRILFDYLVQANQLNQQLKFDISALRNQSDAKGEMLVGASTTVALYLMPRIFSSFCQAFPNIKLQLINRNSENILKALLNHEVDIGIVEGKNKISLVAYHFLLSDEVVAVCAANSLLAQKTQLSLDELRQIPIAIREKGSGTLAVVNDALAQQDISINQLNIQAVIGGTEALKNFILEHGSLAFLPQLSVNKQLKNGELIKIEIQDLNIHRDFYIVQRQGEENHKLSRLFMKHCLSGINF